MQERARKGLLSEQEKATLEAELAQEGGEKKGDCIVM